MNKIKTYEEFINESLVTKELEMKSEEMVSSVNEAAVITPEVAKETKEAIEKAISGIKETPGIDDKTKVNLVKTGIGLAVLNAIAEKFGDLPATTDAKAKMHTFMTKVNSAKSLAETEKVIFDVIDYALEVAQKTKK